MKILQFALFVLVLAAPGSVYATGSVAPTFNLEQKIAYQQGQFGALYAHCGSRDDQKIIDGSLTAWREETFRGYNGTSVERANLEEAFDRAAKDVNADSNTCHDWGKQVAATWSGIIQLARYGTPVALNQ